MRVDTPASQDDAGGNGTGTRRRTRCAAVGISAAERPAATRALNEGDEGEAYHAAPPPGLRAEAAASLH